jgi:hypothetical protein
MRPLHQTLLFLGLVAAAGCSKSPDVATGPIPACQTNGTGLVVFENLSATNSSYDVIWDGATVATIGPGQNSRTFLYPAGQHMLTYKVTNSSTIACATATTTLAACANPSVYSCAA